MSLTQSVIRKDERTHKSWEQITVEAKDAYEEHLSPREFAKWENAVRRAYEAYERKPSPETLAKARALIKPHFDHYARTLVARWGNFNPATHDWTDEETDFFSPATQKPEFRSICGEYIDQLRAEMLAPIEARTFSKLSRSNESCGKGLGSSPGPFFSGLKR